MDIKKKTKTTKTLNTKVGGGNPWRRAALACCLPPGTLPPSMGTPHHIVVDLHQGCGCVEAAQVRVLQALRFLNMVSKKSLPTMRQEANREWKADDKPNHHTVQWNILQFCQSYLTKAEKNFFLKHVINNLSRACFLAQRQARRGSLT